MDSLLRAERLDFAWPQGSPLFQGLSLQAGPGLTWITGDDSSGKTTLLRLLAGEMAPQAGRLCAAGHWLDQDPAAYRRQVFWIDPQTEAHHEQPAGAFLEGLAAHWSRLDTGLMSELVGGFGLAEHLHKPLYMLSTGGRRKVWLTAAFAAGAPLTLIDQPFAALDARSARCLAECLAEAGDHPTRAWLVADHERPDGLDRSAAGKLCPVLALSGPIRPGF